MYKGVSSVNLFLLYLFSLFLRSSFFLFPNLSRSSGGSFLLFPDFSRSSGGSFFLLPNFSRSSGGSFFYFLISPDRVVEVLFPIIFLPMEWWKFSFLLALIFCGISFQ